MPLRIEDYALIGDCHTAALVGRDGSIDWLCLPRFDSSACFAALLGDADNGRWALAPLDEVRQTTRRYRGDSLVLETLYETESGAVTVVDCMPPRRREADLVRLVIGERGEVRMRMQLVIRFDYGSIVPWVRHIEGGIFAVAGPDTLILRTPVELVGENLTTVAEFTVSAGEKVPFVATWYPSHKYPPAKIDAEQLVKFAEDWWGDWSSRCTYSGLYRDAVMRSLITLKALTYAPTGGIVAAATTSLPEQLGGPRNWDYRFCWLRDATFTLDALLIAGYHEEAKAWRDWLLRAVAGTPSQIQIMYGVKGNRRLTELELPWLAGYEKSPPVRIGNAASSQFQLDVYGEVLDMMHQCRQAGIKVAPHDWNLVRKLTQFLETAWHEPDEGIWEVRGGPQHFTHSKMMAWVAFDRAIKAVEEFGCGGPADRWRKMRDEVHAQVCREGFSTKLNSFVQVYGTELLDASLLMMPLVGFLPADDPRVRGTIAAIERHLTSGCFVARYSTESGVDGLPPGEGAFLACSFWLVDNLVLQGRDREARELFEKLLAIRTELGLLSEEYDLTAKRLVGNFPQAFSHVGLVNSAQMLSLHGEPGEKRQERVASRGTKV